MRIRFIIGRVFSGLARNLAMTTSVILVTFISLLFLGIGGLAQIQVMNMKQEWYAKVEVSVYMCAHEDTYPNCQGKAATDQQVQTVKEALETGPLSKYIKEVTFQNHQDVYADFQKQYGETEFGEAIEPEMLPQAFRIKLKDPSQYHLIAQGLNGSPGVEQVQDQSALIKPLMTAFEKATQISWGLAGVMAFAAILLITMTIRLSALSRRKETQIMRLQGASSLFIQLPFLLEGAICALLGAALASGGLLLGVKYLVQGWLAGTITFVRFIGMPEAIYLSIAMTVGAVVIATVASVISLARFAKF